MSVRSTWSMLSFSSEVSFIDFYMDYLSIGDNGVLKSLPLSLVRVYLYL
jgi:hypothetical protein